MARLSVIPALALTIVFASCEDKNNKTDFLTVETTGINFSSGEGIELISYSSNAEIKVVSSQPEWCEVIVGEVGKYIKISVLENVAFSQRTANITVSAGKAEEVKITVNQDGTGPYFRMDEKDTNLTFGLLSDNRYITVDTNVDFTVSSSATWCTIDVNKDISQNNLNVSVTTNDRMTLRTAVIVISASGFEQLVVHVSQDGSIDSKPGMTVKGRVSCNNTGVADVVVSDGYELTVTDADGIYYLPSQKKNGYVFISIPGNYESPAINNIPQFFKRLIADANTEEQANFELTQADNERHAVLAIADWHLANRTNDIAQFNTCLADINSTINSYQAAGVKTYILTLGDMTWDAYWYSNNFLLPQYLGVLKNLNTTVFNTMGNHDNDPYCEGDWNAEQTYRNIIGPTYYSFNLGKAHYVVLDNIVYNNIGGRQGVMGNMSYSATITTDQIEWLKKDLATVADKSAPLIVAMHIQLYNVPNDGNSATFRLTNGQQLVNCLSGFSNVHILTGHTHDNQAMTPTAYPWLMEHNNAAISATWWWTGNTGYSGNHICKDGSVGGYTVWELNGKNAEWYYKGVGYNRNYQFRTYDLNTIHITAEKYAPSANATYKAMAPTYATPYQTENNRNEVLINVFKYDKDWTVEVMEGTQSLPVTRVSTKDPLHIISYEFQRLNRNAEPTSGFVSGNSNHIFRVTASSPNTTLNIKVTDRFGNEYVENMTRPKQFTLNMK